MHSWKSGSAAVLTAFLCASCSTSSTSLVSPTSDKCRIDVSTSSSSFGPNGGSGTVSIFTARDCLWTMSTEVTWVAINGNRDGQGDAVVSYTVAANPAPASRSGAIVVGLQRVQVDQAPAPCRFDLSRTSDSIGTSGGHLSVGIATLTGCAWSAASEADWITVTSGRSGNANGTVELSVGANGGGLRVGQVTIAGHRYTVRQDAAPSPSPPSQPPPPGPTPPSQPPPSMTVDSTGSVSGLSGGCPNLRFVVRGSTFLTDGNTDFKDTNCGAIKNGKVVRVRGVTQVNGTIKATRVELKDDDDDDD